MPHLLVLGSGWVGTAVARAAEKQTAVTVIDPPFDPLLSNRDERATKELQRLITTLGVTRVVNACGRVAGDDEDLYDANLHFAEWLCTTLADSGVKLIHVGSASEYGDPGSARPVSELDQIAPRGAYAESKAAGTRAVIASRATGLDATVARLFNLVAAPIPAVSPIHAWLQELRSIAATRQPDVTPGGRPDTTGDGGGSGAFVEVWWPPTVRDFVTLGDAAQALVDLSGVEDTPALVNVCSGTGLSFGEIAAALANALGLSVEVRSLDRPGIEAVVGDPTLLESLIGWKPEMSLDRLVAAVLDEVT